jgi:Mg-chelatase subunit ChlD
VKDSRDAATIRIPANDGVLLIVDASASMREVLPSGEPRMSVAKTVIEELTQQYLPDGINFGMRVFGHRGGTDCASELMLPVSPLDRAAAKQKLMFIRSSSLGNTSLGEALGKASEDLKGISGLKRVVVLTDGEETCRGDPAAEIVKLADAGLDVTVNIVGFALNDPSVKDAYGTWVRATGGKYYDVSDASALGQALQEAMTPKVLPAFEVYDAAGELVTQGRVGDAAIQLDSGVYEVRILDPDNPRSEWIEAFEQHVSLDYR